MMGWGLLLDAGFVLFLLLFALRGRHKGLFRSLAGLLSVAAALALSIFIGWLCAEWIYTGVVQPILGARLIDWLQSFLTSGVQTLPQELLTLLCDEKTLQSAIEAATNGMTQAGLTILQPALVNVVAVLTAIVLFVPCWILTRFLVRLLNLATKVPGVRWVNRLLGFVFGLCKGVLLLWLLCVLITASLPLLEIAGVFGYVSWLPELLSGSYLYQFFHAWNPLELVLR